MGWLGRVPRLGLVMSEEELLLGQVSLAFIGMEQCFIRVFSLDMTLLGWARIAHCFWAGPHNSPSKLRFLSPSEEKKQGFDVSERMEVRRVWGARAGSYFGRATIYEARPFTPGGFMSPSSNGEAWIGRLAFFLEFLGRSDLFSLLPAI